MSSLGDPYRYEVKIEKNSSNIVSGGSGLKILHKGIMENETLTHKTKERPWNVNLKRASLRHRKRRVSRSLRKTIESGVSSKIAPVTIQMNFTLNSHWWLSSKKKDRNRTWTLIQNTIKRNKSLMQNPLLPSRPQK
jgi:hypothetical protein